jgi:hypothetical protein
VPERREREPEVEAAARWGDTQPRDERRQWNEHTGLDVIAESERGRPGDALERRAAADFELETAGAAGQVAERERDPDVALTDM